MSALKIEFSSAVRNLPRACAELEFGQALIVLDGRYFASQWTRVGQIREIFEQQGAERFADYLNTHYHGFRFGVKRAALMPLAGKQYRGLRYVVQDTLPLSPHEAVTLLSRKLVANNQAIRFGEISPLDEKPKNYILFSDPCLAF